MTLGSLTTVLALIWVTPVASADDGEHGGIGTGISDEGVDVAASEQLASARGTTNSEVAESGHATDRGHGAPAEAQRAFVALGLGKGNPGFYGSQIGQCTSVMEQGTGSTCALEAPWSVSRPQADVPAAPGEDPVVVTVSRSEAASLLVNTGEAMMDGRWQLANMPVLLWTTAAEHTVSTELLGQQVDVRFTPAEHVWDPMDGSAPFSSGDDPGAPYPAHTVSYPYSDGHEAIHVELTTVWEAEFQVGGTGVWEPIDGTIPITTRTEDFEVRERQVRLVPECAVHGRC
ncbi:hypothetical protein [Georgenia sp. Z1491]|uniref:hypothetical protein n=1 Tax=Georgenia sp. Z1491 TaxID=3416707 RepID=UPI003CED53BC